MVLISPTIWFTYKTALVMFFVKWQSCCSDPLFWHLLCSNHCVTRLFSSACLISLVATNTQSKHVPYTVLLSKDCPCFILQGICSPTHLFLSPFHWLFEFTVTFAGTSTVFYTCWNQLSTNIHKSVLMWPSSLLFQFVSAANVINVTFHNYKCNGNNNINIKWR